MLIINKYLKLNDFFLVRMYRTVGTGMLLKKLLTSSKNQSLLFRGAGVGAGVGVGAGEKNARIRNRSKMDRLRNTSVLCDPKKRQRMSQYQ